MQCRATIDRLYEGLLRCSQPIDGHASYHFNYDCHLMWMDHDPLSRTHDEGLVAEYVEFVKYRENL